MASFILSLCYTLASYFVESKYSTILRLRLRHTSPFPPFKMWSLGPYFHEPISTLLVSLLMESSMQASRKYELDCQYLNSCFLGTYYMLYLQIFLRWESFVRRFVFLEMSIIRELFFEVNFEIGSYTQAPNKIVLVCWKMKTKARKLWWMVYICRQWWRQQTKACGDSHESGLART